MISNVPDVSVLIPVLNEADGIAICHRAVSKVLGDSAYSFEIVFIDDGSSDGSKKIIQELVAEHPNVKLVALWRNFGQQLAMLAGMAYCRGKVVITYDSDLQFSPECLPGLTKKVLEGHDIVSGIRQERRDGVFSNKVPSAIGRLLIRRALQVDIKDFGAVKAFSRKLVDNILRDPDKVATLYAECFSVCPHYAEIPVKHQSRTTGVSKWSLFKRMETYFDIYVAYAKRPFNFLIISGVISMVASIILGLGIITYRIMSPKPFAGTIIFFDLFLFFFGIHFFVLSIIGEFVVRIYRHSGVRINSMVDFVLDKSSVGK